MQTEKLLFSSVNLVFFDCYDCRDRGEELHTPTQWSDRWQLSREAFDRFWANYCYLFMDGVWHVSAGRGWMPVAELLE